MIRYLQQIGYAPRSCVWELTLACNLRCKHCGSRAGDRREGELEDHELYRIADELADLGCRRVTLSGGEPTLRPSWDEIGRRLVRRGLKVNLISNGWHWDESHVTKAKDAGLVGAAFSLDGSRAEHDALRREGSYERVVAAIDRTAAAGFPVAVNTTITKLNQHMFHEMRDFLISHGVFAWQLQFATATGNMGDHKDIVVDAADFLWLIPRIAEICRANTRTFFARASDDVGYYGRPEQDLRDYDEALPFWVGCRAGCQVIGIESNGDVKGCLSLPSSVNGEKRFVEGNLRSSSLEAIWKRRGAFSFNRDWTEKDLGGFCAVCRYRDFCRGGCTWTKYTEKTGNAYCFYYQAVKARRLDLLEEEPTAAELAHVQRAP